MPLQKDAILSLRLEGFAEAELAAQKIAAQLYAAGQNAQGLGGAMAAVPREITIAVTETRTLTTEIERAETRAVGLTRELRSGGRLAGLLFAAAGFSGGGGLLGDTFSGAATGAAFGSFFGPVGTAVGAVAGGVGGLAKGLSDDAERNSRAAERQERAEDAELRREQRDNSQALRELTRALERVDRAANRVQISGRGQFADRPIALDDINPAGPTR